MSILIKNMEMPKDCPMCPLAHYNAMREFTGCEIVAGKRFAMNSDEYANSTTRPSWCPLISIPPHGRLIDADALKDKDFRYEIHGIPTARVIFARTIELAPTIIEAEGEVGSDYEIKKEGQ